MSDSLDCNLSIKLLRPWDFYEQNPCQKPSKIRTMCTGHPIVQGSVKPETNQCHFGGGAGDAQKSSGTVVLYVSVQRIQREQSGR